MIISFYNSFCNSSFGLKSRTILVNFINSSFVLKRGVKGIPPASNPRPMINESHTSKEASTNPSLINTKVILPTDEIIKPYSSPKYSRTPRTMPRKSTKDDFPSNKGKLEPIVPMQQKLNSWSASTSNPYVKTSNNNPQLNNNNQQAPQTNTNNKPYRSITGRLFDYFRGNKNVTPIVNEPQALPLAPLVIPNVVPQVVVQDVNALIPILPLVNNVLPNVDSPNASNAVSETPIVIDESLVNNVSSNNSNVSSSSDIPAIVNDSNPIPDASNESISNDVNSIPLGEASSNVIANDTQSVPPVMNKALQQELIEKSSSIGLKTDNAVSAFDTAEDASLIDVQSDVLGVIPIPPPLPPFMPTKINNQSEVSQPINFKEEIESAASIRNDCEVDIQKQLTALDIRISQKSLDLEAKFKALADRGLLDMEETKAKSKFYNYWIKTHTSGIIDVQMSKENISFKIGLLNILDPTIILSGQQSHPIILCAYQNDNLIVWGYLTSEYQKDTIMLTKYQPFSGKDKMQYLKLVQPYVIKNQDIQELPTHQQDNAKNYLNKLKPQISDIFEKKVISKIKGPLNIYDGTGITLNDIDEVIIAFDKHQEEKALVYFEKYKAKIKQGQPTEDWLDNIKKADKDAYNTLKNLIDENN